MNKLWSAFLVCDAFIFKMIDVLLDAIDAVFPYANIILSIALAMAVGLFSHLSGAPVVAQSALQVALMLGSFLRHWRDSDESVFFRLFSWMVVLANPVIPSNAFIHSFGQITLANAFGGLFYVLWFYSTYDPETPRGRTKRVLDTVKSWWADLGSSPLHQGI